MQRVIVDGAMALIVCAATLTKVGAAPLTIAGPAGSGVFGQRVTVLPNGNVVVADPRFDLADGTVDAGAVHLYAPDGSLISTVTGSSTTDFVGSEGVVVLANGNYLIRSPFWDNGVATNAGAVTFATATQGVAGVVGADNSLVGPSRDDFIGFVTALPNGNYVVRSALWDQGAVRDVGAVTFGNGTTGTLGAVDVDNSLIGSSADDHVGSLVVALANGNYVIQSPDWDRGALANAGAVTWADGLSGRTGSVGAGNSLVGSTAEDRVGSVEVVALVNGNYVVRSLLWDNGALVDAGAATFGDGQTGVAGPVDAGNSLVGTSTGDRVGDTPVAALINGNYVVRTPLWDDGLRANVGAVTFGNGQTGIAGAVTSANSLVGSTVGDQVGLNGIARLANGNYVVSSQFWDDGGVANVGAVTFGNGLTGIAGAVDSANSLVGASANDSVTFVAVLSNGNYAAFTPGWDKGGVRDAGAVTFGNGLLGTAGIVGEDNSLIGTKCGRSCRRHGHGADERQLRRAQPGLGSRRDRRRGRTDLRRRTERLDRQRRCGELDGRLPRCWIAWGRTRSCHCPAATTSFALRPGTTAVSPDVGAVVFGDGQSGISGAIDPAAALLGSSSGDQIGSGALIALANGDVVVGSPDWDRDAGGNQGAVTYLSGAGAFAGTITTSNSLLGATANDRIGSELSALLGDRYLVLARSFDRTATPASLIDAGAVVLGKSFGEVGDDNAAFGNTATGGARMAVSSNGEVVAVGRPDDNEVSIFDLRAPPLGGPIFDDGFEDQ